MAKPSSDGPTRRPSALKRALDAAIGEERPVGRADDPAREKFPLLWEWLTLTTDETGEYLIQPGSITVSLGPEGVFATVSLKDIQYSCPCSCTYLEEVFAALEAALGAPNPPVKSWGKTEPHLRKKRKKS